VSPEFDVGHRTVDGGIVQQRIGEVGYGKPLEVSLDGMDCC
jgi:hypothetical protein